MPRSLEARPGRIRSQDGPIQGGTKPVKRLAPRLAVICGALACVIGVLGLLPVLLDLPPAIDRLLVMHRMAAGAFVLGGSGLILLNLGRSRLATVLLFATLALAAINFITLEASLHAWFSDVLGFPLSDDVQMAPMTSALFIASASTILLCRFRGEAAAIPAAIIGTLCVGLVSALLIRFTVAGDYWPVLASVTPHSGTAHALLALGSLASVVARQPALIIDRQRRLVIAMVVLLTALTLVIVGTVSWRDYMATVRDVDGETRNLARLLEEHAHRRLDPVLLLSRQVAAAIEAPQALDVANVRLFIEASASGLPQLAALAIVAVEGSSASLYGPELAWSDTWRPPTEPLLRHEALLLPDPLADSFVLAVPLDGAEVFVVARLDTSYFQGFYQSLQLGEAGGAGLLSAEGHLLVEHGPGDDRAEKWVLLPGGLHQELMAASFIDRTRTSGPERFVAYRRSSVLPFVVSVSVTLTPAIRHFERRLKTVLLLMLGGLTALGVAAHLQMLGIRRQEAMSEAKTRFLANTSHELRTPLTAMLGLSRLLGRSSLAPAQRLHVERIEMAGKALLAIINDILDLAKIEAGKLELESVTFSMASLLAEVEAIFVDAALAKGLKLEINCDERVPARLRGDAIRLQQVLMNLLANALKFTETGGVRLEVDVADGSRDSFCLRFSVQDSGIGMTEAQMAGLFEPFVQADSSMGRRFGGSGLGLAICRRLVEAMRGTLSVESCPGRGSVFFFTVSLPVSEDSIHEQHADVPSQLDGFRVLVVEDNAVNRELICEVLELAGAEAIPAESGTVAIAQLADPSFRVDCTLMDIQMPGIDGLETTARIRAMTDRQSMPIVAVTANAMFSEVQACRQAGMNDYVTKPIDIDALVKTVAAQIRGGARGF